MCLQNIVLVCETSFLVLGQHPGNFLLPIIIQLQPLATAVDCAERDRFMHLFLCVEMTNYKVFFLLTGKFE